jgi:hypothetical protein
MAAPAAVLAFSMLRPARGAAPAAPAAPAPSEPAAEAEAASRKAGLFARRRHPMLGDSPLGAKEARSWYPQRRYDAAGNELPLEFGSDRDVGSIRYADASPAPAAHAGAAASTDEASAGAADPAGEEERLPTIAEVLARNGNGAHADEDQEPVRVDSHGRVISVARPPPPPRAPEPPRVAPSRNDRGFDANPLLGPAYVPSALRPDDADGDDPALPRGVRWKRPEPESASPPPSASPAAGTEPEPEASQRAPAAEVAVEPEAEVEAPAPAPAPPPAPVTLRVAPRPVPAAPSSVRASLRQALDAARDPATNARYLAKLEASGFLADVAPPGAAAPAKPARAPEPEAAKEPPQAKETRKGRRPPKAARRGGAAKKAGPGAKAPQGKAAQGRAAQGKKAHAKGARKPEPKAHAAEPPPPERAVAGKAAAGTGKASAPLAEALREARGDETLARAVEAALERGSVSAVLLTRRLGVGYTAARRLVARLVEAGLLGEAEGSGAHPVRVTRAQWDAR